MNNSILNSIKKLLGVNTEYTVFDEDIIMHINSTFMVLTQLGVGPSEGFSISDASVTWTDFLGDSKTLEATKSYTYMKVRMLFDPPTSSAVMEAMNRSINEFEWRLNISVDKPYDGKE